MRPRRRLSPAELIQRQCFLWRQKAGESKRHGDEFFGPYIAISREFGAGALHVADELFDQLGWTVYDKRLIDDIASDAGVTRMLLDSLDAGARLWMESYAESLPFLRGAGDRPYFRRLVRAVLAISHHGEAIFIGRGVHHILPASAGVRIKVVAPLDFRARVIAEREGLLEEEARVQIARGDEERQAYLDRNFPAAEEPLLDRLFDASKMSHGEVANAILELGFLKLGIRRAQPGFEEYREGPVPGATFDASSMAW